ncbi:MAG TPA: IS200/IS605 family transposase [Firmicutes bacterium]|nr:IS200/IS605 family transposase [Bacillota bacterium]
MGTKRWTTSNKAVYNIGYHLIWCPKYRRKVLVDKVASRLRELFLETSTNLGVTIETMEVMPDHVHLFVKAPPTLAPHYIVQQLKGKSSRRLREEFPHLKSRLPTLWTRRYYCESVGHISESTIRKYIEDQKGK